ncbi:MAG: ParA family protein [Hormoscilla sp. GUM202]|nr:ParA family protein [Hormoscilla sp. GM7CHS1pb]MBO1347810.1 ParA family protein [Hormoscilla sp. GUM202]
MNTTIVAFFNNKGGVGKTSLVYHLAWMYKDLGLRVVAADLDPQANLTAAFLDEDRLEKLWPDGNHHPNTVFGCVQPLIRAIGDIADPHLEYVEDQLSLFPVELALLVGDLSLSGFEDQLSEVWPKCMDSDERAFRVISAFWRIMQNTADRHKADVILMDLGPNLGAINRAALIAADYVVVPLSPDLFSLQGLRNLGPTLRRWRKNWQDRLTQNPADDLELPKGGMQPIGYVVLQHSARFDRPVKAYKRWIAKIPGVYRDAVLDESGDNNISVADDPHCLALLKNYQSLMPMAQEARKPIFYLKPADGAIGAHSSAVKKVYSDFASLAKAIASRIDVKIP